MTNTVKYLSAFLLTFGLIGPAAAKDVVTEQYNVAAAQKAYNEAQSDYDAASLLVTNQEKRVAQEQTTLKEQQKKQAAAKEKLNQAKAQLDRQQKALDKAWKGDGR